MAWTKVLPFLTLEKYVSAVIPNQPAKATAPTPQTMPIIAPVESFSLFICGAGVLTISDCGGVWGVEGACGF
jgi:hypothetical protein